MPGAKEMLEALESCERALPPAWQAPPYAGVGFLLVLIDVESDHVELRTNLNLDGARALAESVARAAADPAGAGAEVEALPRVGLS